MKNISFIDKFKSRNFNIIFVLSILAVMLTIAGIFQHIKNEKLTTTNELLLQTMSRENDNYDEMATKNEELQDQVKESNQEVLDKQEELKNDIDDVKSQTEDSKFEIEETHSELDDAKNDIEDTKREVEEAKEEKD